LDQWPKAPYENHSFVIPVFKQHLMEKRQAINGHRLQQMMLHMVGNLMGCNEKSFPPPGIQRPCVQSSITTQTIGHGRVLRHLTKASAQHVAGHKSDDPEQKQLRVPCQSDHNQETPIKNDAAPDGGLSLSVKASVSLERSPYRFHSSPASLSGQIPPNFARETSLTNGVVDVVSKVRIGIRAC